MSSDKIIVGITQGDINGIGYEVIIKTFLDNRLLEKCIPVLYGSPKVAAYHRKSLNISNFSFNQINSIDDINLKRANIINCLDDNVKVELGKPTEISGNAAYLALQSAVKDMLNQKFEILITAPINKKNIQNKDFNFPGHTEYLQEEFGTEEVLMIMVSNNLRIGVVTSHLPIKEVPASISKELIIKKLKLMNQSLIEDFGIRKPRIAVLGLNPHAGDDGLLGMEEKEIIIPAIEEARQKNIMALGPFAADGLFGSGQYTKFDAILAMYHDQGLIPFKALSFDNGVNYTAGLPIVRTSPAHGTAYDIVGEDTASPESFRQALFLACDIYKNRLEHNKLTKNPLKKYQVDETTEK